MELSELFELMNEEASDHIIGLLSYEGIAIKWEYDSFNVEFDEFESDLEHLHRILHNDLETIKDIINMKNCHISDPTIEDTYISFYIEQ
jgi:hypothetical protein